MFCINRNNKTYNYFKGGIKMKKFLKMMLCVIMVFGLVACDSNPGVSISEGGVFTQPEETAVMSREDAVKMVNKRYKSIDAGDELVVSNIAGDSDQPIVVFIFDNDGLDKTPYARKQACMESLALRTGDRSFGIVQYDKTPQVISPITKILSDEESNEFGLMLSHCAPGTEGSAMYDAIIVGLKMLVDAQEYAPFATLKLVLMSNGHPDTSYSGSKKEEIISLAASLGIQIHTIAFYSNHKLVKTIDLDFDTEGNLKPFEQNMGKKGRQIIKGTHSHKWDISDNGVVGRKSHKANNTFPIDTNSPLLKKIVEFNKQHNKWN